MRWPALGHTGPPASKNEFVFSPGGLHVCPATSEIGAGRDGRAAQFSYADVAIRIGRGRPRRDVCIQSVVGSGFVVHDWFGGLAQRIQDAFVVVSGSGPAFVPRSFEQVSERQLVLVDNVQRGIDMFALYNNVVGPYEFPAFGGRGIVVAAHVSFVFVVAFVVIHFCTKEIPAFFTIVVSFCFSCRRNI